ncbi:MAG: arginine--tRNA ligase [Alphaproteobacteria bacterium]|nr:arginine--tRNA ligase [Alphaproteobacteria bacterium]
MNIHKFVTESVKETLAKVPGIAGADMSAITVEVPRVRDFGDFATNAAMILSKQLGQSPREIADALSPHLKDIPAIKDISVAGPGFININISDDSWDRALCHILANPETYGNSDQGKNEKINVEFLSANPTGPVHIGHARGAILGDVLARLLAKNGFAVTKEYYINDYGHQVNVLGNSVFWRYQELFGMHDGQNIPEGSYPGEYLVQVAQNIKDKDGDIWLGKTKEEYLPHFREFTVAAMMEIIKKSLRQIGIEFDVFTSEKNLVENNKVTGTIDLMRKKGLVYNGCLPRPLGDTDDDWVPEEQLLFKAKEFGDDADRVVARANGAITYFASDIAYHFDKFERRFKKQVDIWGADHGGYVKRIKAAVGAVTDNKAELDILLCQIVSLEKDGKPFRMSKRAGNFVMIEDVLEEIDADVLRLFMVTKSPDTQMSFDLEKAKEQSKDNPVYYIQYAHARANSVLKKYNEIFGGPFQPAEKIDGYFADAADAEKAVVRMLGDYPSVIETAGRNKTPHTLTKYLEELAGLFHSLWSANGVKLLCEDDKALTDRRMLLVTALKNVIANGLNAIGVKPKESM